MEVCQSGCLSVTDIHWLVGSTQKEWIDMFCLFKQKTAYDIEYGLVGSEMCIRDSPKRFRTMPGMGRPPRRYGRSFGAISKGLEKRIKAVSYTHLTLPTSDLV